MDNDRTEEVVQLFAQEIPQVAAGSVEIKAIARKPGIRAKLALRSRDPQVDCIGVCVGLHGYRIKNVVDALGGERVDLLRWNASPARFIEDALQPAAIDEVILHPAERRAVVVVKADQVSLVLGRRGVNLELAGKLCGWVLEVEER